MLTAGRLVLLFTVYQNKKAGPKPRGRSPTDLYRPHPQDSLSLPVTYLREEAVANACGP